MKASIAILLASLVIAGCSTSNRAATLVRPMPDPVLVELSKLPKNDPIRTALAAMPACVYGLEGGNGVDRQLVRRSLDGKMKETVFNFGGRKIHELGLYIKKDHKPAPSGWVVLIANRFPDQTGLCYVDIAPKGAYEGIDRELGVDKCRGPNNPPYVTKELSYCDTAKMSGWQCTATMNLKSYGANHYHSQSLNLVFEKGSSSIRLDQVEKIMGLFSPGILIVYREGHVLAWFLDSDKKIDLFGIDDSYLWYRDMHKADRFKPLNIALRPAVIGGKIYH